MGVSAAYRMPADHQQQNCRNDHEQAEQDELSWPLVADRERLDGAPNEKCRAHREGGRADERSVPRRGDRSEEHAAADHDDEHGPGNA